MVNLLIFYLKKRQKIPYNHNFFNSFSYSDYFFSKSQNFATICFWGGVVILFLNYLQFWVFGKSKNLQFRFFLMKGTKNLSSSNFFKFQT